MRTAKWFKAEDLAAWILDNDILGIILDENTHAELLKRCSYIIKFLGERNKLSTHVLDLLWKCQEGKHEDIVRVIFDTIITISDYFTLTVFNYSFHLIYL